MKKKLLAMTFAIAVLGATTFTAYAYLGSVFFTDVPEGSYYDEAVGRFVSYGVIQGYSDNTFRPGNAVNRAEAVTMFDRYEKNRLHTFFSGSSHQAFNPWTTDKFESGLASFSYAYPSDWVVEEEALGGDFVYGVAMAAPPGPQGDYTIYISSTTVETYDSLDDVIRSARSNVTHLDMNNYEVTFMPSNSNGELFKVRIPYKDNTRAAQVIYILRDLSRDVPIHVLIDGPSQGKYADVMAKVVANVSL
jgi:hypothetical protein